jgi:2'-5' RNA ligase
MRDRHLDSSAKKRFFVSLPVPAAVRTNMQQFQAELKHALPFREIRWARAEQFHLTVRFFGSVDAERVNELTTALLSESRFFSPLRNWTADAVELFRSELSSQGARHSLVAAIPLTAK